MTSARVLGVDACKGGWIGIAIRERTPAAYFGASIGEVVTAAEGDGDVAVVGIDIPIGLPDRGCRKADVGARKAIGTLGSSVFMTPVRAALEASTHAEATALAMSLGGVGVSIQAFSLRAKVLEVERWIRTEPQRAVIEVHPEVTFAEMAGQPLTSRKKTWAGVEHRRRLLAQAEISLGEDLGLAGARAGVDDVLDAAAAAWTAGRYASGRARPLPDPPEMLGGSRCAIWV